MEREVWEEGEKRERQGGEGEREEESQLNHMIQWSIRNPKKGWSPLPPSPVVLQIGASMVRKTGSHRSVFTYAPMSSLRPLPGPQLLCRISRASRTFRLYESWPLFLPCIVFITVALALSNGSLQCWWCCVIPEWCQFSFWMAFPCSSQRSLHDLAVWPT